MTSHDEIKARCEAGRPILRIDVKWLLDANEAKDKLIAALTARAEKAEKERDELKALCRSVCPVCGLKNDRHFQGILCDRCGADIRGAQEEK